MKIRIAVTEDEMTACFRLMSELRPHLSMEEFINSVKRLTATTGYQLVYLEDAGLKAVAGVRISEWLHTGRYLEIEELVTEIGERSKGYGKAMFDWLKCYAIDHSCRQIRLVSGVRRARAHQFYERQGMVFEARYYSLDLPVAG